MTFKSTYEKHERYRLEANGFISMNKQLFEALHEAIMDMLPERVQEWSPAGEFHRGEYMTIHDESERTGESLFINLQTGRWMNIAKKAHGYNPISYYAHVHNVKIHEAVDALFPHLEFWYEHSGRNRVLMW